MTPASEIAIRWYLDENGADEDFSNDLVRTLYEGCGKNEADSAALLDHLLKKAVDAAEGTRWEHVVRLACALHAATREADRVRSGLSRIAEIQEIVDGMREGDLAKRIARLRVAECVAKLRE